MDGEAREIGDVRARIAALSRRARAAARAIGPKGRAPKDDALGAVARAIRAGASGILAANRADVEEAHAGGSRAAAPAMLDRLRLDDARVEAIARAVEHVITLEDPVGRVVPESEVTRPNGVRVKRVRVPIGVIAMIYEARPNVTVEASALCLKAGNAVVLRGGSEARRSNTALAEVIASALASSGFASGNVAAADAVQLVPMTDRDAIRALVQETESIDLVIPRGGEALIRFVTEHARVPVVQHYKGVCHLYVDAGADADMASRIAFDGKLVRPGVCNALECLLVDAKDAARLLPRIADALAGCELRGDERARAIMPRMKPATDDDFGFEFLDAVLAVKIVDGIDGALAHVARFGSGHTEAIVTPSEAHAARWRREVDAACVVVNTSTRFHDGGELGLGAEIGIATSRLHWRGAMGLEALTTHKWIIDGEGQVRG